MQACLKALLSGFSGEPAPPNPLQRSRITWSKAFLPLDKSDCPFDKFLEGDGQRGKNYRLVTIFPSQTPLSWHNIIKEGGLR